MLKRFQLESDKLIQSQNENAPILLFVNPDKAERESLVNDHKIDEHTLSSALDPDELGRMEIEPEHTAIIFKRPKRYTSADNFLFKVRSAGFFLFADKLIIVADDEQGLFEGRPFARVQSLDDLLLRLLCGCVLHFEEHLRGISMISDELEAKINKSLENKHLLSMFTLEKGLVYYLNAVRSNGRVLEKLKVSTTRIGLSTEDVEYLDDLIVENNQCFEQANTYAQVLATLMDARASLVNNNLSMMMKYLNAIVIAVAVPSFFASVGGMSEFSVITGVDNWKMAYAVFIVVMTGMGLGTYFFIRWIERYWRV